MWAYTLVLRTSLELKVIEIDGFIYLFLALEIENYTHNFK